MRETTLFPDRRSSVRLSRRGRGRRREKDEREGVGRGRDELKVGH